MFAEANVSLLRNHTLELEMGQTDLESFEVVSSFLYKISFQKVQPWSELLVNVRHVVEMSVFIRQPPAVH